MDQIKLPYSDRLYNALSKKLTDLDGNCHAVKLKDHIYVPYKLLPYISSFLPISPSKIEDSGLKMTDKIYDKLLDIYKEQSGKLISMLELILNHKSGLINVYTGFGKTWALLGLALIYHDNNPKKNIQIIAKGSAVVEEIKGRLELFGLPSEIIKVSNSAAVRSNNSKYIVQNAEFLDNVGLVIVDECDSITPTLKIFLDSIRNYTNIYGFTATPDYSHGYSLDQRVNINNLPTDIYRIIEYFGPEIYTEKTKQKVKLTNINTELFGITHFTGNKYADYKQFNQAVRYVATSKKFTTALNYISSKITDTLYIPINERYLASEIIKRNPHNDFIIWNANEIYTVGRNYAKRTFKNHLELAKYLGTIPSEYRERIVLATQVAYRGISIPNFTDILFITQSNFRNIIQSIGRIMRCEDPHIWTIQDSKDNNKVFNTLTRKRLRIIKKSYQNLVSEEISL